MQAGIIAGHLGGGFTIDKKEHFNNSIPFLGLCLAMKCRNSVETLLRNKPCALERLCVWKCINSDQLLLVLNPEGPEL